MLEHMNEKDAVEALRRAQEALRHLQKVDSIAQLSGGIAHDLNNALQNIVASLELVRTLNRAGRSGETERFIATAVNAARGAAGLNQRVVSFSRRQPYTPRLVSMNELILGMEDLMRRSLPRSIQLELKLSADAWQTFCDANQAESALLNLILNARDAMPDEGTLTIETSNASVERNGTRLRGM